MPHLLIRGIAPERIRTVAGPLTEELAAVCECPADYFMLECLHTTAVSPDGELVSSYPFIEVAWFDRGLEAQDRFARAVDRHVRQALGLPELEIAFRVYRERDYYANGESFDDDQAQDAPPPEEELESLRQANRKLAEELRKARKALSSSAAGGAMSTRLRDALRE